MHFWFQGALFFKKFVFPVHNNSIRQWDVEENIVCDLFLGASKNKSTIIISWVFFLLMCLKYQIKYGYNMQRLLSVVDFFFSFDVFVIGSKGGMCQVENKSVWFGTTESNVKYPVPTACQTDFRSALPGMWKTIFATEMLLTRSYLTSKVTNVSMGKASCVRTLILSPLKGCH